jgi:hypothetical protein
MAFSIGGKKGLATPVALSGRRGEKGEFRDCRGEAVRVMVQA